MSRTREINYKVSFTGDSKQALQAIQQLKTELASIGNMSVGKNSSQEMKQMVSSAQQLQTHLNRSFDANGNLNLAKFNNSLKTSNTSLAALSTNLLNGGKAGQKAFADLATAVSQAQRPVSSLHGVVGELWYTFKNTIKWGLASSAFNNLTSSLSKAIGYSKQLNTSLNNIRIVTGESAEAMEKFSIYANNTAKALKTTTTEVSDAALIYYQQGDTESVVKQKTEITTKAANVSPDSDAAQMSEYLTAVWNGYQAVEGEYEDYVDKLAAVGAATASSLEEVATGMTKVASTANTVGVDFDQLNAILSTVGSVTREAPETTGTAFKTIFARMEDLKMGETLEDGVTLGSVSKILDKVNISIFDAEGNLRDLGGVLEELMQNWNEWDRSTKVAVAEQLAGKRQYTQLFALLENQDMYYDALKTSQEAEGSLQEMQDIYAESWVAANEKLKASIEDVYNDLINSDFAIGFIDTLSTIVNLIDEIVEGVGGAGAVFSGLGAILTKVFSSQIINSMQQAAYTFSTLTGSAQKQDANVRKTIQSVGAEHLDSTTKLKLKQSNELLNIDEARHNAGRKLTAELERQITLAKQELEIFQQQNLKNQERITYLKEQNTLLEQQAAGIDVRGKTRIKSSVRYESNARNTIGLLSQRPKNDLSYENIIDWNKQFRNFTMGQGKLGNANIQNQFKNLDFTKQFVSLNRELQQTGKITDEIAQKYKKLFNGNTAAYKELKNFLTNIQRQQQESLDKDIEKNEKAKEYIKICQQQVQNLSEQLALEEELLDTDKIHKNIINDINNYSAGAAESVVNMSSALFSMSMGLQSLKNIVEIWNNKDLEPSEKWFQLMTAIGIGLPMLISGFKTLTEIEIIGNTVTTIKEQTLGSIYTITKKREKLEKSINVLKAIENKTTKEQEKLKAKQLQLEKLETLELSKQQVLRNLQIAAIAAAVVAIGALIYYYATLEKRQEKAIRKAHEAMEEAKQTVDDTRSQIESNNTTIQELKGLDELTDTQKAQLIQLQADNAILQQQLKTQEEIARNTATKTIENVAERYNVDMPSLGYTKEEKQQKTSQLMYASRGMNVTQAEQRVDINDAIKQLQVTQEDYGIALEALTDLGIQDTKEGQALLEAIQKKVTEQRMEAFDTVDYVSKFVDDIFSKEKIQEESQKLYDYLLYNTKANMNDIATVFGQDFANKLKEELQAAGMSFDEFLKGVQIKASLSGAVLGGQLGDSITEEMQSALANAATHFDSATNEVVLQSIVSYADKEKIQDLENASNISVKDIADNFGLDDKEIAIIIDRVEDLDNATQKLNGTVKEAAIATGFYISQYKEGNKVIEDFASKEEGQASLLMQGMDQINENGSISGNVLEGLKQIEGLENIDLLSINEQFTLLNQTAQDFIQNLNPEDESFGLQIAGFLHPEQVQQQTQYLTTIEDEWTHYKDITQDVFDQVDSDAGDFLDNLTIENLESFTQSNQTIREGLEALNIDVNKLTDQEEIDLTIDLKGYRETTKSLKDLEERCKEIGENAQKTLTIEMEIKNTKRAVAELKKFNEQTSVIGEGYQVAAEDIESLSNAYPELLDKAKVTAEGMIQLDKEVVESNREKLFAQLGIEGAITDAKINARAAEIEGEIQVLENTKEMLQAKLEATDSSIKLTEEEYNASYQALNSSYSEYTASDVNMSEQGTAEQISDWGQYETEANKAMTEISGSAEQYFNNLIDMSSASGQQMAAAFTAGISGLGEFTSSHVENKFSAGTTTVNKNKEPSKTYTGQDFLNNAHPNYNSRNNTQPQQLFEFDRSEIEKAIAAIEDNINKAKQARNDLLTIGSQALAEIDKAKNIGQSKDKSGGGGKDDKDKEEELVDILEDQIERYHEVNKQIEYQEQVLKRLQNARDKVYGQKYLDALNKEIDGQQEYIGLLQDRMVLYSAMLQSDREAAAALGATFDENGLITNYTSLTEAKLSDIQAQQKGMTDSEKKEQLDQEYEDFKAVLDQYEETFELLNDATTELDDAFTELNDLIADYVKTQIEAIETVQDKLDTINSIEERFYDNWDKMGERSALYNKQLQQTYDTADQWIAEIGQIEEMYKNGLLTQKAYAEAIGDAEEGLAASINTMFDLQEKMAKMVEETVNEVTAKMDQYMAIYEDASKELQFYIDAFTKIYSRSSHAMATELYNNQADVLQQQIKAEEMYMKTLQENQKQWEEYSDEWFQYEEGIREAKDKIISLTTDTLDALSNAYKEQIQAGIQAFNTAIGVTDFDRLTDNFGKLQEESNRFLDYADKLYETTSLQQKINESINKQDSTAGKARLNNLLDELNALSDKAEVSQYEIDYLQKKYELTLKQNALDEANSQKTLRLMRNDQGDMVYSFVADTEKVTSAKQEYETAMNDLRELSEQYVSETSNNLLQYVKDYEDALLNLDETTFESRQEYEEAVNEIVEYYSQLIYDTKEQLNIGEQNLAQDTYDQIVALRGDSTELTIALAQRESDAILGIKNEENDRILANYDEQSTRAREANEKMVSITQDMRDKLGSSYDEIRGKIAETAADAVTAFETWHNKALKVATTTAETLNPELKDTLATLQSAEGASDKLSQALVDLVGNNLEGLTNLDGVFTSISSTLGTMFDTINTNQKAFSEMFDNTAIQGYYDTLQRIINTDLQNNWGYQGGWSSDEMALMKEAARSGQYTDTGLKAYLTYHNSLRNQKLDATPSLQSKYHKYEGEAGFIELLRDLGLERLIEPMSTGGYTKEGGLAFLHDKELVLNATDTENILAAAMILQGKGEAAAAAGINSGLSRAAASFTGSANNVDQSTNTFYVDFPNATSSSEIEIALTNLMNHADQYKFTS